MHASMVFMSRSFQLWPFSAVSIPARSISDEPVSVTLGQVIILAALLILVLPVALLVQGISVYLKRRHS